MDRVLVTGAAGFIGSHLVDRLLEKGIRVYAIDSFNSFYAPAAKRKNIESHLKHQKYKLIEGDIRDGAALSEAFAHGPFDVVVHLAALAGVRPSLLKPAEYMDVNVVGTQKLIDQVRTHPSTRLIYGSSSSVYGNRDQHAFVESDKVNSPFSPYAASKVGGELACHAAHACFSISVVCLRFFTVYGPRQRPDLAIHKFCQLIDQNKPLEVYGDGSTMRDYTFVHDIVSGITAAMTYNCPGFDIINLGRGQPVCLNDMINCLEKSLGKKATRLSKPEQTGDVSYTHASIEKAKHILGYAPSTSLADGIDKFVQWYKEQPGAANVERLS